MRFEHGGQSCMLQGIQPGSLQILQGHQMSKYLHMTPLSPCPMMLATNQHTMLKMSPALTQADLQLLLREYDDVFKTPNTLPPAKTQDHRIPLHNETRVINVRPYKHPTL